MSTQESKPSSKAVQEVLQWLLGRESARYKVKPSGQRSEMPAHAALRDQGLPKPE